jgi:DNA segregation ATPase FtsK/SpoIIIE, S-DNA-T family
VTDSENLTTEEVATNNNVEPKKQEPFLPHHDPESRASFTIISCFAMGFVMLLALAGSAGSLGGFLKSFTEMLFGVGAWLIPFGLIWMGIVLVNLQHKHSLQEDINSRLVWGLIFIMLTIVGFINLIRGVKDIDQSRYGGGVIGFVLYPFLLKPFGVAAIVILFAIFLYGFFLISNFTLAQFLNKLGAGLKNPAQLYELVPDIFELPKLFSKKTKKQETETVTAEETEKPKEITQRILPRLKSGDELPVFAMQDSKDGIMDFTMTSDVSVVGEDYEEVVDEEVEDEEEIIAPKKRVRTRSVPKVQSTNGTPWKAPSLALLKITEQKGDPGDKVVNTETIRQTLNHFNVRAEMGDVVVGPTVSQYMFKPASGVKLTTIENLLRNIALELAVPSVRLAPVQGKNMLGLEVPNKSMALVRLRDMLMEEKYLTSSKLMVVIGKEVTGTTKFYDIAKMPHLLVAGATGSGKSVWINAMLLSLLFKHSPAHLGLILIDMKRVELKLYEGIPHLLTSVITDSDKAINSLKWAIVEMDRRYQLLEEHGKRNIDDYNEDAILSNDMPHLPYIVFVIDELADLMLTAKNEVEPMIARLAQMARAIGIHLVLGTQRPDTSIITGLIKANIPTRIAFAVASEIDSRVILDSNGAGKLLGKGDGLLMSPDSIEPIRFQSPLVDDAEVRETVTHLKEQLSKNAVGSNFRDEITAKQNLKVKVPGMTSSGDDDNDDGAIDTDEAYNEARALVIQYGKASSSFLQQYMGVGYPKAAKIINKLEANGVIGPQNGSKPRAVYESMSVFDNE